MMFSNLDAGNAPIALVCPMNLGLDGVCIVDDEGMEIPLTEDMIVRAFEDIIEHTDDHFQYAA